jgi:argininosuccinate synthase
MGESYDQKDAAGFIKILALPARARVLNAKKKSAAEVTK